MQKMLKLRVHCLHTFELHLSTENANTFFAEKWYAELSFYIQCKTITLEEWKVFIGTHYHFSTLAVRFTQTTYKIVFRYFHWKTIWINRMCPLYSEENSSCGWWAIWQKEIFCFGNLHFLNWIDKPNNWNSVILNKQ